MAARTMVGRVNIGPGPFESPWVPQDEAVRQLGMGEFRFIVTTTEWDADPGMIISLSVEHSPDDGATVYHLAGQTMFGGTRNKADQIPFLPFSLANVPEGSKIRVTGAVSVRIRIGIEGTI